MRQVILDTETTGMKVSEGNRIVEIGAVEMVERRLTGEQFHVYLNPDRDVEVGALEVHGLSRQWLSDKPRFGDVCNRFLEFIRDAELLIHNAVFDVEFLDAELVLHGAGVTVADVAGQVTDTLALARELHPGQQNSLDALCRRYDIDNSNRSLHGALLDSEILAEVYLAMTGGQTDLVLESSRESGAGTGIRLADLDLDRLRIQPARPEEEQAHQARLVAIREKSGHCLWLDGPDSSAEE